MSKSRAVDVSVDRAIRIELRVVERVESFEAEFERLGFCEFCAFVERDIEIGNAWPVEEAPLGISLRP